MTLTFRHRLGSSPEETTDWPRPPARLAWALHEPVEGLDREASRSDWQPRSSAQHDARRSLDIESISRRSRSTNKPRASARRRCGSAATTTFSSSASATCFGSEKPARHTSNSAAASAPRLPRNSSVAEAIESGSGSPMVSLANLRTLNVSKDGSVLEEHGPGCTGTALKSKRRLTWKGLATKSDGEEAKASPAVSADVATTRRKSFKGASKESSDDAVVGAASPRKSGTWLGSKLYRRATLSRLPQCVSSPSIEAKDVHAEVPPPLPPIAPQYLDQSQRSMCSPRRSFHGSKAPSIKSREGPLLWPTSRDAGSSKTSGKAASRTPSVSGSVPRSLTGTTLGPGTPELTTQLEWCTSPPSPSLSQTWESFATSSPLLAHASGTSSLTVSDRRQEIAATERALTGGFAGTGRPRHPGNGSAVAPAWTQLTNDRQGSGLGLGPAPPRRSQRANTFQRPPSVRSNSTSGESAGPFRKRSASSSSSIAGDRPDLHLALQDQQASHDAQRLSAPQSNLTPPSLARLRSAFAGKPTTKRGRSATLSQVEGDTTAVPGQQRSVSVSSSPSSSSSRRQRRVFHPGSAATTTAQPDVIEEMDEEEFRATPPRGVYASLEEDMPGEPFAPGAYPSLCAVGLVTPTFGGNVSRAAGGASASRSRVSIYSMGTSGSLGAESAAPSPQVGRGWEPYTPSSGQPTDHSRGRSISDVGQRHSEESSSSQTSMESLSSVLLPMPTPPITVKSRDGELIDSPISAMLSSNEAERTARTTASLMSAIRQRPAPPPKGRGRSRSPPAGKARAVPQAGGEASPSWATRREQRKTEEEQLQHSQLQACLGLGIVRDEDLAEDRRFW